MTLVYKPVDSDQVSAHIKRDEWLTLLERYHAMPHRKTWAEARVRGVLFGPSVLDWDDNIPSDWARELFERWGLVQWENEKPGDGP